MRCIRILVPLVLFLWAACSRPTRLELQRAAEIQSRIDAVDVLQRRLVFPKHFEHAPAHKRGGEFDVMQILPFFPHLRLEEGYVLDYVYEFGGIGGEPVVYARKANASPFADLEAFVASAPERVHLDEADRAWKQFREDKKAAGNIDASLEAWDRLKKRLAEIPDHDVSHLYLKHVATDESDDGFIELAALSLVGDQFYLFWHAGYKQRTIVLTKEKADKVMSSLGESNRPPDPSQPEPPRLTSALLCPKVVRTAGSVTVSFHVFSRWGGLSRLSFQISPSFPHQIVEKEAEVVVPYDCGIVF